MKSSNSPSLRPLSSHWVHKIAVVAAVTFCALSACPVSGFAPSLSACLSSTSAVNSVLQATPDEHLNCDNAIFAGDNDFWTRRETWTKTASSLLAASAVLSSSPESSLAAEAAMTKAEVISKLAGIPTFCLVNGPGAGPELDGVPFGIYNTQSATATGFFFTSYQTALEALKAASNIDSGRGDGNIWATAKVKVIPLSIAIQLSLSRRRRVAVNEEKGVGGIQVDTVHNLVPSDDGSADAQRLDTSRGQNVKKWETKGRVPLFYIPEPRLKKDFYFFDTNSLIADYKRKHKEDDPGMIFIPEIQLVELIDIFRKAQNSNDWESLRNFVDTIQPSAEARADAIKLLKDEAATKAAPYNFDKVYLVVSAK